MIERRDQEHFDSMLNRLAIMSDALEIFAKGRGRLAGMASTILAVNDEVEATARRAWASAYDPRWQGPAFAPFVAQRHAELALAYATVQTTYDGLCDYGIVPKDMRTEKTTTDMVEALRAEEKELRKQRRARRGVAA